MLKRMPSNTCVAEAGEPFDLSTGPLMRGRLLKLGRT